MIRTLKSKRLGDKTLLIIPLLCHDCWRHIKNVATTFVVQPTIFIVMQTSDKDKDDNILKSVQWIGKTRTHKNTHFYLFIGSPNNTCGLLCFFHFPNPLTDRVFFVEFNTLDYNNHNLKMMINETPGFRVLSVKVRFLFGRGVVFFRDVRPLSLCVTP